MVYKAYSQEEKVDVAIKKVFLTFMDDRQLRQARKETAKLFKLKSEFVIGIQMFFEDEQNLYIVMEYADGGDRRNLL